MKDLGDEFARLLRTARESLEKVLPWGTAFGHGDELNAMLARARELFAEIDGLETMADGWDFIERVDALVAQIVQFAERLQRERNRPN